MKGERLEDEEYDLVGQKINESQEWLLLVIDFCIGERKHEVVFEALLVNELHGLKDASCELHHFFVFPLREGLDDWVRLEYVESFWGSVWVSGHISQTDGRGCSFYEHKISAFVDIDGDAFTCELVHPV